MSAFKAKATIAALASLGVVAAAASALSMATANASASATGATSVSATTAVAWGRNYPAEQLGAGYKNNFEVNPVSVVGLTAIKQMVSASDYSLALLSNGTVRSWGANLKAQLGDNSRQSRGVPGAVLEQLPDGELRELHDVAAIAAAGDHVLALLEDGKVVTWGASEFGERGNGESGLYEVTNQEKTKELVGDAISPRGVAVEVPGLPEPVTAIAAGGITDYAVLANGTLMAWGGNLKGMLGNGESTGPERCFGQAGGKDGLACSTRPVAVCAVAATAPCSAAHGNVLSDVTSVAAGDEPRTRAGAAVAVSNGDAVTWGNNNHGQLGDGTTEAADIPTMVCAVGAAAPCSAGSSLQNVSSVSDGAKFALALLSDGEAVAWGDNSAGELSGTSAEECTNAKCSKTPRVIAGVEHVTAVSAGGSFGLLLSGGEVYAFGNNERGQLGIGSREGPELCGKVPCSRTPVAVAGLGPAVARPVAAIAAGTGPTLGEGHSFASLQNGSGAPPLLSVTPGPHTLEVVWTYSAPHGEFDLHWRREDSLSAIGKQEQAIEATAAAEGAEAEAEIAKKENQAAEAAKLEEEAASLRAEANKLEKEAEALEEAEAEKWSKTVSLSGAQAECSPQKPCRYVIKGYEGEALRAESYGIELNQAKDTAEDRKIIATPLP